MGRIAYLILFFVLNFSALGIGSWLMNSGPTSEWYIGLEKAPWTPPGWVFGAAWTTVMICFSIYMSKLIMVASSVFVWVLYFVQWSLNVSWNWFFFNLHELFIGQIILTALTFVIWLFIYRYRKDVLYFNFLIVPYFLWLLIANSLNFYVLYSN